MRMGFIWLAVLLAGGMAGADPYNGFDVSNATIPVSEILRGGPPRDGIPAIDHPQFTTPAAADFMRTTDEVLSVTLGGETRAYPLRILVWHEIVNDEIGGIPIVVTYCPLCGTAMVFSRSYGGRSLDFGVSGLLYQSDVLMYDRQTESLWSQLEMSTVSGPLVHTKLEWLPSQQLTWDAWTKQYPQGKVLSTKTGFSRNYAHDVYARYRQDPDPMFPVPTHRAELPPKARVVGIVVTGMPRAYPLKELAGRRMLEDGPVRIFYDSASRQVTVENSTTGEALPSVKVYWFAWQAFYPETELWQP